jgi:glycosyltransferase involved in cell wall biosynthesis
VLIVSRTVPLVSVCMPASRPNAWLEGAVRSVLGQTLSDLEVILSDDSGGSLQSVVSSFNDARLRYLPNPSRLGFAANHCRAIEAARGDYVAFLHDDDLWEADYLRLSTEAMAASPEVGLVLAGAEEIDANGLTIGPRPADMPAGVVPDALRRILDPTFMMLLPSLTLVRRRALEANRRPWPNVIAADLTMYIDILKAGWQLHYLDRPLVRYRVHAQQIGTDDYAHRDALVTVWRAYNFRDHEVEMARRRAVARALIGRAAALLRRGEPTRARQDLHAARDASPETARGRRLALGAASLLPSAVRPLVESAWASMGRRHRHQGV